MIGLRPLSPGGGMAYAGDLKSPDAYASCGFDPHPGHHAELEGVLAFFVFPAQWRYRLRTSNLGEGWFKHLRRYLSRFPGCRNAEHSEQVLGCFLLAAESMHR